MVFLSIFTCVFPSSPQYQISLWLIFWKRNGFFISFPCLLHDLLIIYTSLYLNVSVFLLSRFVYFSSIGSCLFLLKCQCVICVEAHFSAVFLKIVFNSIVFICYFQKKLNLILQNNTNIYNILNVFLYVKVTLIFIHSLHSVHFLQRLDFFSFERNQQKEVSCINSDHIFISRLFTFCMLLHFLFFSFIKDDYLSD